MIVETAPYKGVCVDLIGPSTIKAKHGIISVSHKPEVNYLVKNKIVWPTSPQKLANLDLYYSYVKYR